MNSSRAGKPFRIKRQTADGETLHPPTFNLCHACGRPIPTKGNYCTPEHETAHQRLHGNSAA